MILLQGADGSSDLIFASVVYELKRWSLDFYHLKFFDITLILVEELQVVGSYG